MENTSFDLAKVMANIGDDRELLDELIAIFVEDYPKQRERLHAALSAQDAEGINKSAHTIKGSVGVFAAEQAWQLAYELEKIGASGQLDCAQEKMSQMEAEIDNLIQSLLNLA